MFAGSALPARADTESGQISCQAAKLVSDVLIHPREPSFFCSLFGLPVTRIPAAPVILQRLFEEVLAMVMSEVVVRSWLSKG
jgi:hypothetical protein